MRGPAIIARSLSKPVVEDEFGNVWQYHSRSDRHSKIACWAIMFDLLRTSALVRTHAAAGKIGFGINHEMVEFSSNKKKYLDLVICIPNSAATRATTTAFSELASRYDIDLTPDETEELTVLPALFLRPVGDVLVAVEAKAAMTKHSGAGPRFSDELTSAYQCINGSAQNAIAVGFAMVNAAAEFVSTDSNKVPRALEEPKVNRANQPDATFHIMERLRKLRVRNVASDTGYDAIGVLTIRMRNDGGGVELPIGSPAVETNDAFHYEMMIRRITSIYNSRFASL